MSERTVKKTPRESLHRKIKSRQVKAVLLADEDVVERWTDVKLCRGLGTDLEVAKYLLSLHFDNIRKSSDTMCENCSTPLISLCQKCGQSPSGKSWSKKCKKHTSVINLGKSTKLHKQINLKQKSSFIKMKHMLEPINKSITHEDKQPQMTACLKLVKNDLHTTVTGQTCKFENKRLKASCLMLSNRDLHATFGDQTCDFDSSSDTDIEYSKHKYPYKDRNMHSSTISDDFCHTRKEKDDDTQNALDNNKAKDYEASDDKYIMETTKKEDICGTDRHTTTDEEVLQTKHVQIIPSAAETKSREFFCPVCRTAISGLHNHISHMKAHDNLKNTTGGYKCSMCQTKFKTFYGLHKHIKITVAERQCSTCEALFSSRCEISRHKRVHKMESRRFCSWCMASFPCLDKDAFNKHLKSHGYKYWLKFAKTECLCAQCGKVFSGKYQLEHHMTSHSKDDPFPCTFPDCNKAFKNEKNLRQHLIFHGEKKHQCDICGAKFFRNAHLQLHMQKHTGKKYQCEECSRWYYSKSGLKNHVEAFHKGVRKFNCPLCEAKFYNKSSLKSHVSSHNGIKMFQCDKCPATFRRKCGLEKHVLRHTCKKPYKCADCGQMYSCQSSFRSHRKKNHSDSVYPCSCGINFNLQSSLDFHRKMYHGIFKQAIHTMSEITADEQADELID